MRYKVFTTMMFFGLLILPTARAQSSEPLRVDIPFDFGVKDTVFPAGNYQLSYDQPKGVVSIGGLDQNRGKFFALTILTDAVSRPRDEKGLLVFNRYGQTYFLSQVWQGHGARSVIELPKTKRERHLIARISSPGMELASITVPVR